MRFKFFFYFLNFIFVSTAQKNTDQKKARIDLVLLMIIINLTVRCST